MINYVDNAESSWFKHKDDREWDFEKYVRRAEEYPHHLCPMHEIVNYNFKIMYTYDETEF